MNRKNEIEEWLCHADEDMESAEILYQHYRKPNNVICFHCQQAAEKYLKAFLVYSGIEFEKTHDLLSIVNSCRVVEESFLDLIREIYYGNSKTGWC